MSPLAPVFVCACRGRTVVTVVDGSFFNPPAGSKRRFCDPARRKAAWRRRKAGVPEARAPQRTGGRLEGWPKVVGPRADRGMS